MPDFIDTHAHIYLDDFKEDIEQVIATCLAGGVEKVFMPNIDADSIEDMLALERRFPKLLCHDGPASVLGKTRV